MEEGIIQFIVLKCAVQCLSCRVMSNSLRPPWTVACQAPLSMGFPRQEYWSGLSFPFSGDVPDPGMEIEFPAFAGRLLTTEPVGKSLRYI